ncbi:MAG: RagB/SusD family nutrient uptake outer membrane protein [Phocaeicola sp.]
MKLKVILSLTLLFSSLAFSSCNFLDKLPENKVPESNVDFTNLANMYQPVSGTYAKLRTSAMHWIIWGITEVRDDDVWSGRIDDQAELLTIGENFIYNEAYWGFNEYWNQFYGIIKVANAALESLDSYAAHITTAADLARYHSYCGEVRTIRAFAYYRLVQAFGPVTILQSNSQIDMTRSSVQAVYNYMLTENLNYAMEHLPKLRPNEMEHVGAVSAYTAQTLAAKVYLNMAKYDKVEELTDAIIQSNKFKLYDDYYQLFKIPGKLCDESIFEQQNTDFGSGSGQIVDADQWFPFQGPQNDGNISGWGFIGIQTEFRAWARERGETVRATTSFLAADTTTPSGDYIRPQSNPTATDCWNGKAYTPLNQMTDGRTKYGSNNNIRILRYADVLLMNAEAKVRLGKSGTQGYNLVRERAKMPTATSVTLEDVLEERRMEFVAEWGDRYNDLVRTGQAASILAPKGWTEEKTYFPIPLEQKNLNETLKNPIKD